jgi:hypothetical protein
VGQQRGPDLAPIAEIGLHSRVVVGCWRTLIEQDERVIFSEPPGDRGRNHALGPGNQHAHWSTMVWIGGPHYVTARAEATVAAGP